MNRLITVLGICLMCIFPAAAQKDFFDRGKAPKFVEAELHLLLGGTAQTENYMSCFPEIREINSTMNFAWGAGAVAELGLRDYLAIGTQLNVIMGNTRVDMAVSNDEATSVSGIYLNNRFYYINIPLYISFRFNVARNLRWNVDGGLYYSYGFAGKQKQTVYTSMVNELGNLVSRVTTTRPSFYNDRGTFINSFYRGDIGLHIATGLNFAKHYHVGVQGSIGLKNISHTTGIRNPNIHNISIFFTLGYRF